jgi:hypothetical protein
MPIYRESPRSEEVPFPQFGLSDGPDPNCVRVALLGGRCKYRTHPPRLTLPQGFEVQFRTQRDHSRQGGIRQAENYLTRFRVIGPGPPPSNPPPSILI